MYLLLAQRNIWRIALFTACCQNFCIGAEDKVISVCLYSKFKVKISLVRLLV